MTVFSIISLLGGLALFLYGMRIMGDGLKRSSSSALKKAMEKVTNSPIVGFLLGMAVTCVIQSSTATIVLTSGLVGAGIISLHQSLGIIIGANVGTTITGQIIRLLDINADAASWVNVFKPSTLAPIAAIIGILLIMAFKFRSSDTIGGICMGFGILFTGLLTMTNAVTPLSESAVFSSLFLSLADKPVLGYLAGAAVAFAIQSSSAAVGILQALSMTGQLSFSSVYSVIIGIYLGDCITTAIVCSIGARADAKRTGIVHILFNISESILVIIAVTILHKIGAFDSFWSSPITSGGIANAHTLFKLCTAVLLLPVCGLFEKLSCKIVKDDKVKPSPIDAEIESLDKALYGSPALALSSAHSAIAAMASLSCTAVSGALNVLKQYDEKQIELVNEDEVYIDTLADKISSYLVRMSPYIADQRESDKVNYYIKCVSEFERIGDYAVNITENAQELVSKNASFSPSAKAELSLIREAIEEILGYSKAAFIDQNFISAKHIEPVEEVVDDLVSAMRQNHIQRLREGLCNVDAGFTFLDILVNLERISDQCSNIGVYTVSLYDSKAAELQHDYIEHLHQGEDPGFNAEYEFAHEEYFNKLEKIYSKL